MAYDGISVTEQAKIVTAIGSQRWERNKSYKQGWFTLRNPSSGLFLKANSVLPSPVIEGILTAMINKPGLHFLSKLFSLIIRLC